MKGHVWMLFVVLSSACGNEEAPPAETPEELERALEGASPGDTVRVADGVFEGAFVVPGGVRLCGAGKDRTTIVGSVGQIAILSEVGPGETTEICDLSVEWRNEAGIVVRGEGSATIEDVDLRMHDGERSGIGLAVEGLASLSLARVDAEGPFDGTPLDPPDGAVTLQDWVALTAAFGIVAVDTASVTATEVTVRGFEMGGVHLVGSHTSWSGGAVCSNLQAGIFVHGGTAALDGVAICDLRAGGLLVPTYGLMIVADAAVTTNGLSVTGTGESTVGIVQDEASSTHADLTVTGHSQQGFQAQHCPGTADARSLEITGASDLSGNGIGGLVLLESSGVLVDGLTVDGTECERADPMGDGIQIVRCGDAGAVCESQLTDVELRNVTLRNNCRAGLVVSANDASAAGVTVEGVTVSGEGTMLGAISQLSSAPPTGWEGQITREGATAANDDLFDDVLETVGVIYPDFTPASALADGGLEAALGEI